MSGQVLQIPTPRVFLPLVEPARYKGAYGGRGSGKSHFFAEMLIERCVAQPGLRAVCIREVQKSLAQSVKQLLEDKIRSLGVEDMFDVLLSEIRTPGDGLIIFQGMSTHNAASIKSLEGFDVAWIEEAQTLSARSLALLRPTIRKAGSEIWASWNPENEDDPIDQFLRRDRPPNSIVVEANYTDNPWCPQELLDEAEIDRADPDKFEHVWKGGYKKAVEGAYYTADLKQADEQGRICQLERDPILTIKASWDIGVSDSTAIWVAQWVGGRINWLDYIEGQGQPLAYYLEQLRQRGYDGCTCILPHDGAHRDNFTALRYEDHVRDAGFNVEVVRNQGKGAAMQRIEAMRRLFPRMWFDSEKTWAGRKALAAYHEKRDEDRGIGLGPDHDWTSHAADSAGLMAIAYREPSNVIAPPKRDKKWVV